MIYRALADFVFLFHFAYVLFAIFGGLLVLRWRWLMWFHLPALAWAIIVEFFQVPCPLTTLEKRFKELGGEQGYEGGFIEHYVSMILYANITPQFQMMLGVILLVFNLLVYWHVFRRNHSLK
jgi:hypothetical protein